MKEMNDDEIRKAKIDLVCKILTNYRKKHPEDHKMSAAICAAVEALDYVDDIYLYTLNYIDLEWEEEEMNRSRKSSLVL